MTTAIEIPNWARTYGDYTLEVLTVDGGFLPCLKKGENEQYLLTYKTEQQAKSALIDAYHEVSKGLTVDQIHYVDVDLLYNHPKNSIVYINDNVDDLVNSLSVEVPYVAVLEVTKTGRVVAGNRRLKAIGIINNKCLEEGKQRAISTVPVFVKHYAYPEDELNQLILNNRQRPYSPFLKGMEAYLLIEIQEMKGKRLKAIARSGIKTAEDALLVKERDDFKAASNTSEKAVRSADVIAKETGFDGRVSMTQTVNAVGLVKSLIEDGKDALAAKVQKVIDETTSAKLRNDLTKIPTEFLEEICDQVIANPKKANVNKLIDEKRKEKALKESNGKVHTDNSLDNRVRLAIDLGDKPEDNRFTPITLIDSGIHVFGRYPDLDPCAPLVDEVKPVPALKWFTIQDDALKQKWEGTIFTNFPFSQQPQFFQKLDQEISAGHTKEGIVVCESGALFAIKSQDIIAKHQMTICLYKGRIEFTKGGLYKAVKEQGEESETKTTNRSSTAIVYYGDKHNDFVEEFSVYGDCRLSPGLNLAPKSDKADTDAVIPVIKWLQDGKDTWKTLLAGKAIAITKTPKNLFTVSVDSNVIESAAHSERFAKTLAIAYIIDSASLSPF